MAKEGSECAAEEQNKKQYICIASKKEPFHRCLLFLIEGRANERVGHAVIRRRMGVSSRGGGGSVR